jgi:hypothetical protein
MSRFGPALVIWVSLLLVACPPVVGGSGDDDDATTPADDTGCAPHEVVDASCVEVPVELVDLETWCDEAVMQPLIIRDLPTWDAFLLSCDFDQPDPLVGMDWTAFDVVGTLATAGGCNGTAGTGWLARCGDEHHLSYWSTGCGQCDAIWTTTHFMTVSAGESIQTLLLDECVPTGQECG